MLRSILQDPSLVSFEILEQAFGCIDLLIDCKSFIPACNSVFHETWLVLVPIAVWIDDKNANQFWDQILLGANRPWVVGWITMVKL